MYHCHSTCRFWLGWGRKLDYSTGIIKHLIVAPGKAASKIDCEPAQAEMRHSCTAVPRPSRLWTQSFCRFRLISLFFPWSSLRLLLLPGSVLLLVALVYNNVLVRTAFWHGRQESRRMSKASQAPSCVIGVQLCWVRGAVALVGVPLAATQLLEKLFSKPVFGLPPSGKPINRGGGFSPPTSLDGFPGGKNPSGSQLRVCRTTPQGPG
jgi:hypothetical protein